MSGKRLFIQGLLFVSMFMLGTGVIMFMDEFESCVVGKLSCNSNFRIVTNS